MQSRGPNDLRTDLCAGTGAKSSFPSAELDQLDLFFTLRDLPAAVDYWLLEGETNSRRGTAI